MMKRLLMAAALMPSLAYANPVQTNQGGPATQAQVYGDNSAASASMSRATATQRQGQGQAQGQHQTATGGAGGNVTVSNSGGGGSGSFVGFNNPGGFGNAPCGGGIGLGGIGLGGGGSGGGTLWEFRDCKVLREAAGLASLGLRDIAFAELCQQIDRVRQANGGACPGDTVTPAQAPAPKVTEDWHTTVYRADYCDTRNAGDANQHRECDHGAKTITTPVQDRSNFGGGN